MPTPLTDNDLLARYLSGDITARQEAELQRRALTDTDLRAAMEGIELLPEADHAASVERMLNRVTKQAEDETPIAQPTAAIRALPQTRRPLVRYWYGAAAGVAVLLVAIFLLPKFLPPDAGLVAYEPQTEESFPMEVPAEPSLADDAPESMVEFIEAEPVPEATQPPTRRTSPAPPPTPAPATPPQTITAINRERVAATAPEPAPVIEQEVVAEEVESLYEIDGAVANTKRKQTQAPAPMQAQGRRSTVIELPTINGRVLDEFGVPIAGATVRLPGLPTGITTDSSGSFQLIADAVTTEFIVEATGYETEQVTSVDNAEPVQINLESTPAPVNVADEVGSSVTYDLDETGFPTRRQRSFATVDEGLRNLRRRIMDEAPEALRGQRVKVSFLVNPAGLLSRLNFKDDASPAARDYVSEALRATEGWSVRYGDEPVRVFLKFNL